MDPKKLVAEEKKISKLVKEQGAWSIRFNFMVSKIRYDLYHHKDDKFCVWRERLHTIDYAGMIKRGACPNPEHRKVKLELKEGKLVCPVCGLEVEKKRFDEIKRLWAFQPEANADKIIEDLYGPMLRKCKKLSKDRREKEEKRIIDRIVKLHYGDHEENKKMRERIKREVQLHGFKVY